nr:MAG TPA: Sporulation protein Cse60 [Bacteriophage sp.]
MIKTKYLVTSQSFDFVEKIDDLINDFLEENSSIEVIDIKYQSNISAVSDGGVSGIYYNNSALIIYKEGEKND